MNKNRGDTEFEQKVSKFLEDFLARVSSRQSFKLVVVAHTLSMVRTVSDFLADKGVKVWITTAGIPAEDRQAALNSVKGGEGIRVLVTTAQLNTGQNLQFFDAMVVVPRTEDTPTKPRIAVNSYVRQRTRKFSECSVCAREGNAETTVVSLSTKPLKFEPEEAPVYEEGLDFGLKVEQPFAHAERDIRWTLPASPLTPRQRRALAVSVCLRSEDPTRMENWRSVSQVNARKAGGITELVVRELLGLQPHQPTPRSGTLLTSVDDRDNHDVSLRLLTILHAVVSTPATADMAKFLVDALAQALARDPATGRSLNFVEVSWYTSV
jgi:hypothetical protein